MIDTKQLEYYTKLTLKQIMDIINNNKYVYIYSYEGREFPLLDKLAHTLAEKHKNIKILKHWTDYDETCKFPVIILTLLINKHNINDCNYEYISLANINPKKFKDGHISLQVLIDTHYSNLHETIQFIINTIKHN